MYLKTLHIENIRSIKKLSLDFTSATDVRRCVLILGNNGVGKTTILRCIALGLCNDTSASALLSELAVGDLKRHESKRDPLIRLTLTTPDGNDVTIETTLKKTVSGLEVNVDAPKHFPWERIFCCGYGIARRPFAAESYRDYRLVDSVYSLFNYESTLWSPEVVLSRLERAKIDHKDLFQRLEDILELPTDSLSLGESGIVIKGPWKGDLGLFSLGDGYSATLGWLADMLGWSLLHYGADLDMNSLTGIVLVDMIERDLHPSWQRKILVKLRHHFPGLQFIMTTHAPMCAIGASELDDDECELVALQLDGDHVTAVENLRPPRDSRVDEVLTSILFNVSDVSGTALRNQLERYSNLFSRKQTNRLTKVERAELHLLQDQITERFGSETFESRLLEFLSIATNESLQRRIGELSKKELQAGIEFVEKLRNSLQGDGQ